MVRAGRWRPTPVEEVMEGFVGAFGRHADRAIGDHASLVSRFTDHKLDAALLGIVVALRQRSGISQSHWSSVTSGIRMGQVPVGHGGVYWPGSTRSCSSRCRRSLVIRIVTD